MRHLHQTSAVSQYILAKELGISLGSINFCFQALVEKGLAEMQNFRQGKLRYAYLLTPVGAGYEVQADVGVFGAESGGV